jgi:pantoate--beta-alanine ligase
MLIHTIAELQSHLKNQTSIGFVPTMGFLHEGHLSLIRQAKAENKVVVVSIFVNPTQFAPNEDYEAYPRDLQRDYKLSTEAGADYVFNPTAEAIYVSGASTSVIVEGNITTRLCGQSRPTHFKGVTTVVALLFNIVQPTTAYFGQKDAQQAILIQKMVRDLHMNLVVKVCPIVREIDGLAMSSRNIYLNPDERTQATILNKALNLALNAYHKGEHNVNQLRSLITNQIQSQPLADIDYVEILDAHNLSDIETIETNAIAAVAVRFGQTRLIDNIFFK